MRTDHFADSIVRYVGGDAGDIRTITGIATEDMPDVDDGRGRGYIHRRTIETAAATVIVAGDAVKIGSNRYEVEKVDDPTNGLKTVHVVRYQPETQGLKPLGNGDH
jgi:hypothetical protein